MLKVTRLQKAFTDPSGQPGPFALRDISFSINSGNLVSILGANGSGKSTLLRAIAGDLFIDRGSIELVDPEGPSFMLNSLLMEERAGLVSRVFQNPLMGTVPDFTIEQNLALAHVKRQSRKPRVLGKLKFALTPPLREEFRALLAQVRLGLESRLEEKVSNLSGGQRQALALAMAFYSRPKLVLLDEHCSALDPVASDQIMRITMQFTRSMNMTVLMVTHHMGYARQYSDQILILQNGRIKKDIGKSEIEDLTSELLVQMLYSEKE